MARATADRFPTADVCELLRLSVPTKGDTYVTARFTVNQLRTLLTLEAADRDEAQNDSPSIGQFLEYFETVSYPVQFIGYVVFPPRRDARISVEGFEAEPHTQAERDDLRKRFGRADEFDCREGYCRAWWD